MSGPVVVAAALASALAAALSSILQHRSARMASGHRTGRFLGHLLTRPAWIGGGLLAVVGLVLHAVALDHGELAVVQPLLISGVLFALPASAWLEGRRPSGREWLLAVAVVVGLAAFLLSARPSRGMVNLDADLLAWGVGVGMAVVALLAILGVRRPDWHAAAVLGTAAGIGYGVVAALLKQTLVLVRYGVGAVVADWPIYALVAVGAASVALTQIAYRAGPLSRSMPALTVTDPAASVILGVFAFGERLATDPLALAGQVVGFLVMTASAAQLARRQASSGEAVLPPL
jgi:drug/metabolite transporter (DMT)-like permease